MQLTPVALDVVVQGMKQYPANMADFMDMFPTEDACLEYLSIVRWPDGYKCLRCGKGDSWKKARGLFTCRACGYEASVLAGTLFQDTHKPLRLWFQAMWYVVNQKNGVSALGLQKALGLGSYHTAWEWLHKLRRAMVRPGRDRLSGIVEVDETFLGGKRRGRGRGAEGKSLIFIAAEEAKDSENAIGRIRLSVLENATGETLAKAVQAAVEPGSLIRSDGRRSRDDPRRARRPPFRGGSCQGGERQRGRNDRSLKPKFLVSLSQGNTNNQTAKPPALLERLTAVQH